MTKTASHHWRTLCCRRQDPWFLGNQTACTLSLSGARPAAQYLTPPENQHRAHCFPRPGAFRAAVCWATTCRPLVASHPAATPPSRSAALPPMFPGLVCRSWFNFSSPLQNILLLLKLFKLYIASFVSDDASDYQKQLKQMIKDLAKEKPKSETELPQMSQVWTVFCVN